MKIWLFTVAYPGDDGPRYDATISMVVAAPNQEAATELFLDRAWINTDDGPVRTATQIAHGSVYTEATTICHDICHG